MKIYYDLHIHSCLSPCADNNMTPADIAGIGALNGLTLMALTDHNSCLNCPAFFEACEFYGIIPIAGMELTTSEDIHVVCLFPRLNPAMEFSEYVYKRLMPIKNKPDIFGDQFIADTDGNTIGTVENLLIGATDISVDEVKGIVSDFGGICYPAHIDRDSNGIIAILGDIPCEAGFTSAELRDSEKVEFYKENYPICRDFRFVKGSDAHRLTDISTRADFLEYPDNCEKSVCEWLMEILSGCN